MPPTARTAPCDIRHGHIGSHGGIDRAGTWRDMICERCPGCAAPTTTDRRCRAWRATALAWRRRSTANRTVR